MHKKGIQTPVKKLIKNFMKSPKKVQKKTKLEPKTETSTQIMDLNIRIASLEKERYQLAKDLNSSQEAKTSELEDYERSLEEKKMK